MKNLALILVLFSLCGCNQRNATAPADTNSSIPVDQNLPKIVAFGNSLTAGLGLPASKSYPALLQEMLQKDGYQYEVVNAGVSGDTTAGGLRRLEWSLEGNVKFLILELGANDILRGQPISEMKSNLAQIITKAQEHDVKVILAGMESPTNTGPEYRKEVHEAYQELAREHDVVFYPFFLEGVVKSEKFWQQDGSHPNEEGTRIIAQNIYQTIKPLL